jgi:drug/metabolite transporter (DMT)-like permease
MTLSFAGIFASTLTGFALAFYYLLNKKVSGAGRPLAVVLWILVAELPVFLAWALSEWPLNVSPAYIVPGCGVLLLTLAGNLLAIQALSRSPFSLMVPVLGLSPVFTSLLGIPILHEWPSWTQWIGITLSVLGVLWLYLPPERWWDITALWSGFVREHGAPAMALSALAWAMGSAMDKLSMHYAAPAFHALFVFTGLVIGLGLVLVHRVGVASLTPPKGHITLFFVTGTLGALCSLGQLVALQHMPAGPFEAIKRVMSQVLAVLLGHFLFAEPITRPKMIGIGILSVGVPLIVL